MSAHCTCRKREIGALLLLFCLVSAPACAADERVAITHVNIINLDGGRMAADMTIIVSGGRIIEVKSTRRFRPAAGVRVVDGGHRFAVPGLWDMHIHSGGYENGKHILPLLVANGITGIRDMGTAPEDILRLRKEVREGSILGPEMVVSGPLLETTLPPQMAGNPMLLSAGTPEQARTDVDMLKERGVDFVKVHDSVPRAAYFAIAQEAGRDGLPFAGHIPPSVTAAEASNAGQRSVEHLGGNYQGVLLGCSSKEDQLRAVALQLLESSIESVRNSKPPDDAAVFRREFVAPIVDSFDSRRAEALISVFKRNNTWQTPTLVALQRNWDSLSPTAEDKESGSRVLTLAFKLVQMMQRAGVGLLAGTDLQLMGARSRLPDELVLLVHAGLTPIEALRAATVNPQRFLGRKGNLSIQVGSDANLVLLDGDPTQDIERIREVSMVVLRGKIISAGELRELRRVSTGE